MWAWKLAIVVIGFRYGAATLLQAGPGNRVPCAPGKNHYIGPIQYMTAPPHGDVRPELFLPLPGHDPTAQRIERMEGIKRGKAPDIRRNARAFARPKRREAHGHQSDRRPPSDHERAQDEFAAYPQDLRQHPRNQRNAEPHRGSARKL